MMERWTVKLQVSDPQAMGINLPGGLRQREPHVYPVSLTY
jgi:hypothetical protein